MDKVTLTEKGLVFMTRFAAPSILTGRFVAAVVGSNMESIVEAFTAPGEILVQNTEQLYDDKTYTGYRRIVEIGDGQGQDEIIIKLDKGEEAADG